MKITLLPLGVGIVSGIFGAMFCVYSSMYALGVIGGILAVLLLPAMFEGGMHYLFWDTAWAPILMLLPMMWFGTGLLYWILDQNE